VYDLGNQWTAYGSVTEIHKSQANMLAGPAPGAALDPIKGAASSWA
jgi:outer membrane receptor for ferric coprogen and ferric-rhodotorulic acid